MKSLTRHISEKLVLTNKSKIRNSLKDSGFEYVDLELPSCNMWAVTNVGADEETDCGDYFSWGEIEPKEVYNWKTYKWCEQSFDSLTKYCTDSVFGYEGFIDNIIQLEPKTESVQYFVSESKLCSHHLYVFQL